MEENQSTPDVSSGQAVETSSPDVASGQGQSEQVVGVGTEQSGTVSPEVDWQSKFQQQANNANQKITELAQSRATLESKLQEFEAQQASRNQALAQALGFGPQQEQQNDILSQLVDDPQFLERKIQEIAQQQVNPIIQEREMEKLNTFAAEQELEKSQVLQDLMGTMDEATAKKIVESINVSHLVSPEVLQLNQRLQNDPLMSEQEKAQAAQKIQSETWKALQQAGGYRKLAHAALGETLMADPNSFMQSAARNYQSRQMQQQRAGAMSSMTGSAGQSSSGGTSFRSESVFR